MKKVTKDELVQVLASSNAAQVTITSLTETKMTKTDNPFYHKEGRSYVADKVVMKRKVQTYDFGSSYQERVNERLLEEQKDATFKSEPLKWGEWFIEGKVIKHKDTYYIRVYMKDDEKSDVTYLVDNVEATPSEVDTIRKFTQIRDASSNTQEAAGLDVEHQVKPNAISFDNIVSIEIDGETYEM